MQLSIITINYNNPDGLDRTIRSVAEQSVRPFEYIVVDGASTKGDPEIIKNNEKYITKWVSEPDGGIYTAINKGTRMATGEYCLFLNSGDTLYDGEVCAKIAALNYTEDFLEGRVFHNGEYTIPNRNYTLAAFLYGHNPYHQGSLIRRELIIENPYDESFRIAGDLDFNIRVLIIRGCSFRPISLVVSNYEDGGRSETINHEDEKKRCYSYFSKQILEDYKNLWWIRQFHSIPIFKLICSLSLLLLKRLLCHCLLPIKKIKNKVKVKRER